MKKNIKIRPFLKVCAICIGVEISTPKLCSMHKNFEFFCTSRLTKKEEWGCGNHVGRAVKLCFQRAKIRDFSLRKAKNCVQKRNAVRKTEPPSIKKSVTKGRFTEKKGGGKRAAKACGTGICGLFDT